MGVEKKVYVIELGEIIEKHVVEGSV